MRMTEVGFILLEVGGKPLQLIFQLHKNQDMIYNSISYIKEILAKIIHCHFEILIQKLLVS